MTTPAKKNRDEENDGYNPFEQRELAHPTTDLETLMHLVKGSLGLGFWAVPNAFLNAGLWFGLVATIIVGVICTYCVHILVKCAHILCRRNKIPSLGFADIGETAFLNGPARVVKYAPVVRFCIDLFLSMTLLGACCVYTIFVATNTRQVVEHYWPEMTFHIRIYIAVLLPPLILINLIRSLKFLIPFSVIANILMLIGIVITFYYIFTDMPSVSDRPAFGPIIELPLFFGIVIFALEAIGVVMSLENNMKTPTHFIGCPGVLNFGMGFIIAIYTLFGFFGYLKYGAEVRGSITLNLPTDEYAAQSVKLMIAIGIFLTYTLQFYVPMGIIWRSMKGRFPQHENLAEYSLRISLVILTVLVAIAIPNLGPFIGLIGALCLSTLGLIFPPLIEIIVYWDEPGLGRCKWILWKNVALMLFGLVGLMIGTYVSILEIITEYSVDKH